MYWQMDPIYAAGYFSRHGFLRFPPVDPLDEEGLDKLRSRRGHLQHIKEYLRATDIKPWYSRGELARRSYRPPGMNTRILLSFGTHGRGALEELMMGSVTKLIKDSEIYLCM